MTLWAGCTLTAGHRCNVIGLERLAWPGHCANVTGLIGFCLYYCLQGVIHINTSTLSISMHSYKQNAKTQQCYYYHDNYSTHCHVKKNELISEWKESNDGHTWANDSNSHHCLLFHCRSLQFIDIVEKCNMIWILQMFMDLVTDRNSLGMDLVRQPMQTALFSLFL